MFVVVSQRPAFCQEWTDILSKWGSARQADSLPAGQSALRATVPRLAVIDSRLLDAEPPIPIHELRQRCGEARLLLGDTAFEPLEELAALAAGAVACCAVGSAREDLERIVGIILQGGVWVSSASIPLLVAKLQAFSARPEHQPATAPPDRLESLTQRQREVAELVCQGANNKQIARALDITDRTVKAHLTSIFEKLGTSDRLQLALYVTKRNPG